MLELTTLQKSIIKRNYRTVESLQNKVNKIEEKIEKQRLKFEEKVSNLRLEKAEILESIGAFEIPVLEMTGGFSSTQVENEDTTSPLYIKENGVWTDNPDYYLISEVVIEEEPTDETTQEEVNDTSILPDPNIEEPVEKTIEETIEELVEDTPTEEVAVESTSEEPFELPQW